MAAVPIRGDFDAPTLRAVAKKTKDAAQARRLLAFAAVYDGATRTEAAVIGDVTLQIVRDCSQMTIPCSRDNPKIFGGYDTEIVGDRIA